MPIFEYECQVCATKTEVLQRLNQSIEEVCPSGCPKGCGHTLKRLVSAPRVRFSGSGYYETDEKPKEKQRNVVRKDDASQISTSSSSSEKKSSTKTEKPKTSQAKQSSSSTSQSA